MFVSIYYKPSLFNAHTMILIVHIFMNVNKLCLNQEKIKIKMDDGVASFSTRFGGFVLFVDLWEAQPCLGNPE